MSQTGAGSRAVTFDFGSDVLKWVSLAAAASNFVLFAWATVLTYGRAPPQPERLAAPVGSSVMTADDIFASKARFQNANLVDHESLDGMRSYFREDCLAWTPIRLVWLTEDNLANSQFGKTLASFAPVEQAPMRQTLRRQLQHVDVTNFEVTPSQMGGWQQGDLSRANLGCFPP